MKHSLATAKELDQAQFDRACLMRALPAMMLYLAGSSALCLLLLA